MLRAARLPRVFFIYLTTPHAEIIATRPLAALKSSTTLEITKALAACKEDAAERDKQQAAAHALAIDDYKRQLDALRKKLEEASTISVEASKASAIASAESSKLAYESILLLTGGSAPDSAKKADSLDGFTPEPAK